MAEHVSDQEMIVENDDDVIVIDDDSNDSAPPEKTSVELAELKKDEGNLYFKKKEYQEAIAYYTAAINLQPNVASYYGNRSACYLMLNNYKEALEDANKSISLDPNFSKGYIRIVKCCLALGDFPTARRHIERLTNLGEGASVTAEANALNEISRLQSDADALYEKGEYRRVVYCMDRILASGCNAPAFKIRKAECLAYLKRFQEAQELANSILQFDKQNADAIYVRGLCLYYEDNIDQAFAHFKCALQYAPDHKKVHVIYKKAKALKQKKDEGNEAFNSGRFQDALNSYNEALLIDPENTVNCAKLYFNRATVYSKLGKLKESVNDCTAALRYDEKYIKAILRRAKCYTELGEYEEAVRDYEAACKMDGSRENKKLLQDAKLELKKSKRKDYYKILGITKTASTEEIKKAYRKRALIHHPDRHANASETERLAQEKQFKEVGEAYGVLSDPKKRAKYDNGQDLEDMEGMDFDPNTVFRAFFGGDPGSGGYTFHTGGFPGGFTFQFG